jgi:uncharacterized membrane protein YeaQ/YmgE (transglycosylase-associated protein family)/predicted RNA-binding Zn-ribbon protein involved in translation (DUF1610 family)
MTVQEIKKEKVIKGITCPSCGGELDMREGIKTFNCKYCGTLLAVKGEEGPIRYHVKKKVNKDEAIQRTLSWLGSGLSKAGGLKHNSKIEEAFLVYIPFWRVKADAIGWVFGQEKKTRSSGNRIETYYVDAEKKIQQSFDANYAACDVSELGVKKVNLTGDDIFPVEFESLQSEGMIFNIVSSKEEVFSTACGQFADSARSSANLYNITFEHFDLIGENISVIYYPIWVVRYCYQNRTYQVCVDADDGSICYGKAPGNNLYRAIIGITGTAAGVFLMTLFGVFALIGQADKVSIVCFIFSFIGGIILVKAAYKKFRYGGEVEQGTGIINEEDKISSAKKALKSGYLTDDNSMALIKGIAAEGMIMGGLSIFRNSLRS